NAIFFGFLVFDVDPKKKKFLKNNFLGQKVQDFSYCSDVLDTFAGYFLLVRKVVAEATSNTRLVCVRPRSLARGHDKSCDPRHGTKISLILTSGPRIRD